MHNVANDTGVEYAPSGESLENGQDLFRGRIIAGPWIGHDVEVEVSDAEGEHEDSHLFFVAEYRFNSGPIKGAGDELSSVSFYALSDLWEWLTPYPVQWLEPQDQNTD